MSLAWCVGDMTTLMEECMKDLQVLGRLLLFFFKWLLVNLSPLLSHFLPLPLVRLEECGGRLRGRTLPAEAGLHRAALQDRKQDLPLPPDALNKQPDPVRQYKAFFFSTFFMRPCRKLNGILVKCQIRTSTWCFCRVNGAYRLIKGHSKCHGNVSMSS